MRKPSKKLIETWDKKLAKAGHVEIEDRDTGMLKTWSDHYFRRRYSPEAFAAKQRYYELCTDWLNDGFFDTGTEKEIWDMHSNGLTLVEIAAKVKMSKTKVNEIIFKIRKQAGIRDVQRKASKGK